jgi:hypothetical protein
MATWGNTTSTATDYRTVNNNFRGIEITINETGNITSVHARVAESTTANEHNWKAEIYDDSANPVHLGSSDVVSTVGTSIGWVEFAFSTPVAVTSGNTYHVVLWSDAGSSEARLMHDSGAGITAAGLHQTYPTPPDPWTSQYTDARYYSVYVTVSGVVGRSIDSIDSFRRGDTGSTISCTGMDASPSTQTVTITDGTHSDTCTVNSWSATAIDIDVDCELPPGTYDIEITDDTGTETLSDQLLLIETGWETIVFDGNTPPVDEDSLAREVIIDHPEIPEVVAGDTFGVESHADVTWAVDTSVVIDPAGEHTLSYWFWDESTGTMYSGPLSITIDSGSSVAARIAVTTINFLIRG